MSSPTATIHPVELWVGGRLLPVFSVVRKPCPGRWVELQQAKRAGSLDRSVSVDDPEFAVERVLLGFDGVERHM
jgi:hypothetical protein